MNDAPAGPNDLFSAAAGTAAAGSSAGVTPTPAGGPDLGRVEVQAFLNALQKSKLVPRDVLAKALEKFNAATRDNLPARRRTAVFAEFLVRQGLLTAWQTEQLARGRTEFFLGSNKLLALLGAGGMSEVFLAEQTSMGRRIAIKVLPAHMVRDETCRRRFLQEARVIASLDHPNIVQAFSCEQQGSTWYLTMQYVPGRDLQRLVDAEGPLDPYRAADFIRQAARGLLHAHGKGMVHRDIKPGNLLVDPRQVVKILDLGIARLATQEEGSLTLDQREQVLGTADYLAPEQALDSHRIDHRADIYSLGCTLYFLLAKQVPFPTGTLAQKLMKHQLETPPSLLELRPELPPRLVEICERMMAKKAADRHADCGELLTELDEFLTAAPDGSAFPGSGSQSHSQSGSGPQTAIRLQEPTAELRTDRFPWPLAIVTMATALTAGFLGYWGLLLLGLAGNSAPAVRIVASPHPAAAKPLSTAKPAPTRAAIPEPTKRAATPEPTKRAARPAPTATAAASVLGTAAPASTDFPQPPPAEPLPSEPVGEEFGLPATVERIVDGDTIYVTLDGRSESVQFLNVEGPKEVKGEAEQPFRAESTAALKELLPPGKAIRLDFQVAGKLERDRYNRILAYVFSDGKNLNVEQVRSGYSDYITRFGRSRFEAEFEAAAAEARAARRNRWADGSFR